MVGQKVEDYDLKALIQEVDLDQNGTISFNEFLRLVYTMVHPKEHSQNQKGLAKLLSMGIAQGVLNELEDAIAKSKVIFHEWWNADLIAEEKRLEAKREKRRKQLEAKRIKQEKDRQVYNQHQQILQEREKKRWQPIDGLVHEIEFKGDQNNYPNIGQYARIHYVGMLQNGTVVESTRKRGGALEIRVGAGHVIQGFDLALQRMSVGETAKITLAPILAYGAKGRPPKIPPNAILIFRIELISIKEKVLPLDIMLDG
jgi:FK506-binding protein 1